VTAGEKLIAEGLARGLAKGLVEGRVEGRVHEARVALLRVLGRRGFKLPVELEKRVMTEQDLARLERWLEAAVAAAEV